MAINDFFEKEIVLKYIGRHFQKIMKCSQQELGEKIGKNQSYVNRVLNGKAPGTKSQLLEFAKALGMSEKDYEKLIKEAKQEEYRTYYGEEINTLPIEGMDITEYEKEELGKVLFSKMSGKEATKEDVEKMLQVIRLYIDR